MTLDGEVAAFAPGHITGFFQVVDDDPDPLAVGSRGAGFSVAHGATSRIRILEHGMPGVTVRVDGKPFDAYTTRKAVELLVGQRQVHVQVEQRMDLPVGQGFGMSSAGALSAALATASLLKLSREDAVKAAHTAEVLQRTGLGDVVGAAVGGFEVRARPGVPPLGDVRSWRPEGPVGEVALCVVSDAVSTKKVLTDPRRRKDINAAGALQVDAFLARPSLSRFVEASRSFALSAKLVPEAMLALWDELGPSVAVGQCQLGGSVFAFGTADAARRILSKAGSVVMTRIDTQGARLVEASSLAR